MGALNKHMLYQTAECAPEHTSTRRRSFTFCYNIIVGGRAAIALRHHLIW